MQKKLPFPNKHGGNRKHGWARKQKRRGKRVAVPHRRRALVEERYPQHVTLRLCEGLASLRRQNVFAFVREALRKGKEREDERGDAFRLLHFSVQTNHLHLIVEASSTVALSRGMQSLSIRLAKGLNRLWQRRGQVFAHRYHAVELRTPTQIRNTLRYVLSNARKHGQALRPNELDPCSSAAWFDGWRRGAGGSSLADAHCPVTAARGFLVRVGWRRKGLIDPNDCPRGG
jgi:REP element-mobilizing transposase RayT